MRTPRWVVVTYVILILAGVIAALPNMFTPQQLAALPSWVPKQQITLGLDLQGGSHLVLEVDAAALKTDRLRSLLDDVRGTLRKERIDSRSARIFSGVITVTIDNPDQLAKAQEALGAMATPVGIGGQLDLHRRPHPAPARRLVETPPRARGGRVGRPRRRLTPPLPEPSFPRRLRRPMKKPQHCRLTIIGEPSLHSYLRKRAGRFRGGER